MSTPNIDRLADEGGRYTRAYCTAPACSPSRSAMMSGVYQTRIDDHDHRRVGNVTFPAFTQYLREAGYFCAAGCGYSGKTDLSFEPATRLFDGKNWNKAKPSQPIFAQITLYGTHRMDVAGRKWQSVRDASKRPVDPAAAQLPPYFPDVPEVRADWAVYLDQIQKMDAQVGEIVQRLKDEGRYDSAMVIFCGDNGRCHLRAKNGLYEPGLKVPLIIKWPSGERSGQVVDGLVSMLDVTATIVELARAKAERPLDGRSLAGTNPPARRHIFSARDAGGEVKDHIRAVCDGRRKYIRNYCPELGYLESKYTREHRPMLSVMQRLKKEGKLAAPQLLVLREVKPKEELYDLASDPHEIHNLAEAPLHAEHLRRLSEELDRWIAETQDTGLRDISWEP